MVNYLVQMSGVPGSGKSELARQLARKLPAIMLDHDVTKSAILRSGVSESEAGAASYEVIKALSAQILHQGSSVIIDSPCLYAELVEHGMHTASQEAAEYKYIECQLADMDELERRLQARDTKPSQIQSLDQIFRHAGADPTLARDLIEDWAGRMQRPEDNWLLLDTSKPLAECLSEALAYVRQ